MFEIQPIAITDSYKLGHASQYPSGTEYVYSNFTPRSDKNFVVPEGYKINKIIWFGLQATIREMVELWDSMFFDKDIEEVVSNFSYLIRPFIGDNEFNFQSIVDLHTLGYLPFHIKSLPEGSRVNIGVPVFTVANTNPKFFWLTNYVETYLSAESWKIATNATMGDRYRVILEDYAEKTGGSKEFIDFQGHDFSMRGMSGYMDAIKNCSGHALSFKGSDNIHAVSYLQYYYDAGDFVFCSVPATEHSVMCAGGELNEKETIRRIIQDIYPTGPVSIVSDSWDFWNVITNTALELKDVILNRGVDSNGISKVVFRPDSGDPVKIICGENIECFTSQEYHEGWIEEHISIKVEAETDHGECGPSQVVEIIKVDDQYFEATFNLFWNRHDKQYYFLEEVILAHMVEIKPEPHHLGAVECLWNIFGGTVNEKGYKTLNQKVGLIYGDSITLQREQEILEGLMKKGFASDNIVFGVGSFTYQYNTRDTFGMAMKATYAIINGQAVELFKNPKTDNGTKKSAKGLLRVELEDGEFVLYDQQTLTQEKFGKLRTVYQNGHFYNVENLDTIKQRLGR